MGFNLGNIIGSATNTINNDVVQPLQRDVVAPIANAYNRTATAFNPQHGLPNFPSDSKNVPYDQRNQYQPGTFTGASTLSGSTELRPQSSPVNRFFGTLNRDIVQPTVRAVTNQPSPYTPDQYTNHILDVAQKSYGLTPQFRNDIVKTGARFIDANNSQDQTLSGDTFIGKNGYAGGYNVDNRFKNAPSILIDKNSGNENTLAQALVHEGLHSEWDKMTPQQKALYAVTAQNALPNTHGMVDFGQKNTVGSGRSLAPRDWLQSMIGSGYEFKPNELGGFNNIPSLPEHAINEAHSYLPAQYYQGQMQMPDALKKQYSQWLYAPQTQSTLPTPQNSALLKLLGKK